MLQICKVAYREVQHHSVMSRAVQSESWSQNRGIFLALRSQSQEKSAESDSSPI